VGDCDFTNRPFLAQWITPSPSALHYSKSFFSYYNDVIKKWMIIKRILLEEFFCLDASGVRLLNKQSSTAI
jgi:hypothetical protein